MRIRILIISLWMSLSGVVAAETAAQLEEIERLYSGFSTEFAVPDVRAARVLEKNDRLLVDVRTEAERKVSILPGAIDQRTYEALPKAERQNAVIYCTIGVRSGAYVAELAKEGIESTNLAGGLLSWAHAGGEMVLAGEVVEQAHVYGRRWRLLPEPYESQWFWWVL